MLSKITNYLILVFLFLLPWQTRWIYGEATLQGRAWEYGTLSFYGTEILLWLIVILTAVRLFGNKLFWSNLKEKAHFRERYPAIFIGAALALFAGYFYAVSPVKEISTQFISRLIGAMCLTVCLAANQIGFYKMSRAFWLGALGQGIFAIGQFFAQKIIACKWLGLAAHNVTDTGTAVVQTAGERWLRAYGSFGWPNSLAIYLVAGFLIGVFLFARSSKRIQPLILGGQLIIFAGLFFTFSRGTFLALGAGYVAYIIIAKLKKQDIIPAVKQGVAVILLFAALSSIYSPLVFGRLSSAGYLERISLNERQLQYAQAIRIFSVAPLTGVGLGLYTYSLAKNFTAPSYGTFQPVHNIYTLSLVELGIIFYILFALWPARLCYTIWQKNPLFLAVIFAVLVSGFFDHFLWSLYAGQVLFWAILGLGLAKNEIADMSSKGSP
jgi:O-antigen ligase